jgi:lipopolysaccharide export LptBFGC system permease protein LptF
MPPLAGCLAIAGYYVAMNTVVGLGRNLTLSAVTAVWIPNIAFVILSVAIIKLSERQDNKAAGA